MRAKLILESPDQYSDDKLDKYVEWDNVEYLPLTFGWFRGKLYWTDEIIKRGQEYTQEINGVKIKPNTYGNKNERILTHRELASINKLETEDEDGFKNNDVGRIDYEFPGRLWRKSKVVSFWNHPTKEQMPEVLKELGTAIGEKIYDNPEWRIEIKDKVDMGYNYKLVPATDYSGSDKLSNKELAQQHVMSPMLKKPNSSGPGKMKSKHMPLAWRQAMYAESVQENLNENPNATIDPKVWNRYKDQPSYTPKKIEYREPGNIPFGFYGPDKIFVRGTSRDTHMDVLRKAVKKDLIQTADDVKERGPLSGRIFTNIKVISFWNYPKDYNELLNIIEDIEKNTKLKILNDPEWRIEVPAGEFKSAIDDNKNGWGSWYPRIGQMEMVPIKDYRGGHQRSEEDMGQQHVLSPMDPKKQQLRPHKSSKTQGLDRLKMRQAMYQESYYPRLK